jgi:hypothetical protein
MIGGDSVFLSKYSGAWEQEMEATTQKSSWLNKRTLYQTKDKKFGPGAT